MLMYNVNDRHKAGEIGNFHVRVTENRRSTSSVVTCVQCKEIMGPAWKYFHETVISILHNVVLRYNIKESDEYSFQAPSVLLLIQCNEF